MQGNPAQTFVEQLQAKQSGTATPSTTQPPQQAEAAPAAPAHVKIMLGSRTFDTTEDLARYAQGLEEKERQFEQVRQLTNPVQPARDVFDDVEDMIYSNPKEALRKVSQQARQDAELSIMNKINAEKVERKFYEKNPDLVGQEDFVKFIYAKEQKELAQLPEEQALSKLANAARARIASIRGTQGQGQAQTLPDSRATTAPSSSGAPQAAGTQVKQRTSMLDQMRSLQSRGSKTKSASR